MRYFHGIIFQGAGGADDSHFPSDEEISRLGEQDTFAHEVDRRKIAFERGKRPSHCNLSNVFLKRVLANALQLSGALQQPAHPTSEAESRLCELGDAIMAQEIEDAVRDIAAALLGREIILGDKCQYPPSPENLTGVDLEKLARTLFVTDYDWDDFYPGNGGRFLSQESIIMNELNNGMEKAIEVLQSTVNGIRSGTVSTGLVDSIKVPNHGQMTPIKFLATTAKLGPDSIAIDPYDASQTNTIAKCLSDAGFSAYPFSKTRVLVSVPPPSGDQKKEIISRLKLLGEECKISIRNIRKNYRQKLSKEESKDQDKEIQVTTDSYIAQVDEIINGKVNGI